jgi:hypothetical protein
MKKMHIQIQDRMKQKDNKIGIYLLFKQRRTLDGIRVEIMCQSEECLPVEKCSSDARKL